ncbi:DDB1- and CUL4-associated factor 4 [Pelodytes ibericus]
MGPKRGNRSQPARNDDSASNQPSDADSSSSSSTPQTRAAPELPGFYYDPEKNRYFRLLPGHNNSNPLTNELLQQQAMERLRKKMLEDDKHRNISPRPGLNAPGLVMAQRIGLLPSTTYCRRAHELKVSCMKRKNVFIDSPGSTGPGTHNYDLIMADSTCQWIFAVNDIENGFVKYGLLGLDGLCKDIATVCSHENPYYINKKVNAACWASLTSLDSHVLYPFTENVVTPSPRLQNELFCQFCLCLRGKSGSDGTITIIPACLLMNQRAEREDGLPEVLYSFKVDNHVWTCAWCTNPALGEICAAGLTKQFMVLNSVTDKRNVFSLASDVLAQHFAKQSVVLYNGCRSGEAFGIDLRLPSTSRKWTKTVSLTHSSSIVSLQLLRDENYLMASDMSGGIKLWDIRMSRCVKSYMGHNNSYAILPLHVSEDEGLLLAVGQDCCTRIWSLQDAKLLRTIPSPHPASKNFIPSIVFSSHLGGKRKMVPGLLMAVEKKLFHFTYNNTNTV